MHTKNICVTGDLAKFVSSQCTQENIRVTGDLAKVVSSQCTKKYLCHRGLGKIFTLVTSTILGHMGNSELKVHLAIIKRKKSCAEGSCVILHSKWQKNHIFRSLRDLKQSLNYYYVLLCMSPSFEVKQSRTFCAISLPFLNQLQSNFGF